MLFDSRIFVAQFVVCFLIASPKAYCVEKAERIFHNGIVVTMEPGVEFAEAVATADGKIIAVGKSEEIKQLGDANTDFVDLDGKTLMPGFVDPHLHPYLGALLLPMEFITPEDWELPGRTAKAVSDKATYLKRLKEAEAKLDDAQEWLFVWGFHHVFHGQIDRRDLDKISSERPIVLWHRSFHEIYFNTVALEAMELTEADVEGVPHTNWEKGHFYETGGEIVLPKLLPKLLEPNRFSQGLSQFKELVHQGGITTIADLSAYLLGEEEFNLTKNGLDRSSVPFRTLMIADGMAPAKRNSGNPMAAVDFVRELKKKSGKKVFFIDHVKLFSDGAFFSQLMQLNEPYLDGHSGEWLMKPAELKEAAQAFWHSGFRIHVHTNGDQGVDIVLDILEQLQSQKAIEDHRFTLEHFGVSTVAQAKRIAELGACVSANPYYLHVLGELYAEQGLGPERAHHISRCGSLVNNNVRLALHSDLTMAPARPLFLAWCAINRKGLSGKTLGASEKISVDAAMRAITIDAAFVLGQESEIGSIKKGKRADFVILGQNPYKVDPMMLHKIPVVMTVFEGAIHKIKP